MPRTCPGRVLRLGSGPSPSGGARGARASGGGERHSASASSQQPPGRQHVLGETRRLSAMRWSSRPLVTRLNLRSTRQVLASAASRREAAPALPMQLRCRVNSQGAGACVRHLRSPAARAWAAASRSAFCCRRRHLTGAPRRRARLVPPASPMRPPSSASVVTAHAGRSASAMARAPSSPTRGLPPKSRVVSDGHRDSEFASVCSAACVSPTLWSSSVCTLRLQTRSTTAGRSSRQNWRQ
mmetsp:Transcript_44990/g.146136  ORF Transcript_44990/g.146136 Transcript_44990/m.146136 type:complete len:240 (-) Transcript_44990:71-790(-)